MRRYFHRLLVLVALALACIGGLSAFGAASAAAANCQPAASSIWYSAGKWYYQAVLQNCTGTSGARFYGASDGSANTGIYDITHLQAHATSDNGVIYYAGFGSYVNTFGTPIWGQGCGYPPFTAQPYFSWQIRNSVGNTWGSKIKSYLYSGLLC